MLWSTLEYRRVLRSTLEYPGVPRISPPVRRGEAKAVALEQRCGRVAQPNRRDASQIDELLKLRPSEAKRAIHHNPRSSTRREWRGARCMSCTDGLAELLVRPAGLGSSQTASSVPASTALHGQWIRYASSLDRPSSAHVCDTIALTLATRSAMMQPRTPILQQTQRGPQHNPLQPTRDTNGGFRRACSNALRTSAAAVVLPGSLPITKTLSESGSPRSAAPISRWFEYLAVHRSRAEHAERATPWSNRPKGPRRGRRGACERASYAEAAHHAEGEWGWDGVGQ